MQEGSEEQLFLLSLLLHAADISNPAKPRPQYLNWTDRVLAEFYAVGELERERGLAISMFSDKTQPKLAKCQMGFINFIVMPMFTQWGAFIPELGELSIHHITSNLAIWAADICNVSADQLFADEAKASWDAAESKWVLQPDVLEFSYTQGLLSEATSCHKSMIVRSTKLRTPIFRNFYLSTRCLPSLNIKSIYINHRFYLTESERGDTHVH